jgi:hypothetical protein
LKVQTPTHEVADQPHNGHRRTIGCVDIGSVIERATHEKKVLGVVKH